MSNKDVFMMTEGNDWLSRNESKLQERDITKHPSFVAVDRVLSQVTEKVDSKPRILEIGCSSGTVLAALCERHDVDVYGVDPSTDAIAKAHGSGIDAHVATADALPFNDGFFDVVLFGFCLYVCDRKDLFRIAMEADRVLCANSWVVIHDFFSPKSVSKSYSHSDGVRMNKDDFRQMFLWHPFYECFSHEVVATETGLPTDNVDDWVCTSVLRRSEGSELA